jgi:hypothetical protein
MLVILDGDLGELLLRRAVLPHVLDAGLTEDGGHQPTAEHALRAHTAAPACTAAEKPHLAHLLDADGHRHVVCARRDRKVGLSKRRGSGRTSIRDVDHGNAGLPDLLQDPLADHRVRLEQIPAGEELDVAQAEVGVPEREERGFAAEVGDVPIGIAAEADHADADDVRVSHGNSPQLGRK